MSFPSRRAPRHLAVALLAVVGIVACDTSGTFSPGSQRWGFIYVGALRNGAGEYRTSPNAQFFRGSVSSVPDARLRTDSCFVVGDYTPASSGTLTGVTYLDAGESITAAIGGVSTTVPRVSGSGTITYALGAGSSVGYRPGDSVVVTVPGVAGGFPTAGVRAKTAEPFTFDPIAPSTATIPLKWTAATDLNSAMLVSLQYTPSGAGAKTQEIRCAFTDDGVDSIPLRQHQAWSAATNVNRAVTVTRLRTAIISVDGGNMELISTFQSPPPASP